MTAMRRVDSIDIVRGLVMIVMAIDHVRVYSGVPAGGPTAAVFFTRWVTHFAAPAFVFLAGSSAYLHGRKLGDRNQLARFLVTRGLWLVVLELTVIRIAWTFDLDFEHYMLAGVIWVIGLSMIVLAALVYVPRLAIGAIGVGIIALHNLVDILHPVHGFAGGPLWSTILYTGGPHGPMFVLYSLIPWVGVMAAGYAFGAVFELAPERRQALCLRIGAALVVAFVVLRALDIYGDPQSWRADAGVLRFLSTTKYPASLDFLLMTLGPILLALGAAERWPVSNPLVGALATFGRVPLFYYLLHIPLIHAAACIVSLVRDGEVSSWLVGHHPAGPPPLPDGYMWSLPLLYAVWIACVVALYVPCRWFANLRAQRRSPWLTYL